LTDTGYSRLYNVERNDRITQENVNTVLASMFTLLGPRLTKYMGVSSYRAERIFSIIDMVSDYKYSKLLYMHACSKPL